MLDPKLKPLWKEVTFWILSMISLPGIIALYAGAWDAIGAGTFKQEDFTLAAFALPVVAYLLSRQYPRGKAAESAGYMLAALAATTPQESNPDMTGKLTPGLSEADPIDDDETVEDYTARVDHPDDYTDGGV